MCPEVFKIVQTMDKSKLESKLALQCAPVIVGIKMSNILTVTSEEEAMLESILRETGITHYPLLRYEVKSVCLLYRRVELESYLQETLVQQFFLSNGYEDLSLAGIFKIVKQRYETYMINKEDFPHEMGLLLGYPLEDVQGFIRNKGKNYLYTSYWKVYTDVEEKKQLFQAYENAKEGLLLLVANGYEIRPILEFFCNHGYCSFLKT